MENHEPQVAAALDEIEALLEAAEARSGGKPVLKLTRSEAARYEELLSRPDVRAGIYSRERIITLFGHVLPEEAHARLIDTAFSTNEELGNKWRDRQAQEVIAVLARHGVTPVNPELTLLHCTRCGRDYEPKIEHTHGGNQTIQPGSGQLAFTGWQCPNGCGELR